MIIRISFPVQDYEGTDIFEQEMFFNVNSPEELTRKKVISIIEELHKRDSAYEEYLGCWNKVLRAAIFVDWIYLSNCLIQSSESIEVEVFIQGGGMKKITGNVTWRLIDVY
jgi:hypothetical protein